MPDTQLTIDENGNVTGGNLQSWEAFVEFEPINLDGFDADYFEMGLDENDTPLAIFFYQQGPVRPPSGGQPGAPGGVRVNGGVSGTLNWRSNGTTTVVTARNGAGVVTGTTTTSVETYDRGAAVTVNLNIEGDTGGVIKKILKFFRRIT